MNTTIDLIGAALSVVSAYFYIKEKSIAWLISLIAIPFDIFMDISIGVYADLLLQFTYLALLLYGWFCWRQGETNDKLLPIIKLPTWQLSLTVGVTLIPIAITWVCLTLYTDSNVALLDATVTIMSLLAQWLLCRKVIQSWLLWALTDSLYVLLYVTKQMPFHMLMSVFDTTVCIIGYVCWVRELRQAAQETTTPKSKIPLVNTSGSDSSFRQISTVGAANVNERNF